MEPISKGSAHLGYFPGHEMGAMVAGKSEGVKP